MAFYLRHYHVESVDDTLAAAELCDEKAYATRREAWDVLQAIVDGSRECGTDVRLAPWTPPQGEAYLIHGRRSHITHLVALEPERARA